MNKNSDKNLTVIKRMHFRQNWGTISASAWMGSWFNRGWVGY